VRDSLVENTRIARTTTEILQAEDGPYHGGDHLGRILALNYAASSEVLTVSVNISPRQLCGRSALDRSNEQSEENARMFSTTKRRRLVFRSGRVYYLRVWNRCRLRAGSASNIPINDSLTSLLALARLTKIWSPFWTFTGGRPSPSTIVTSAVASLCHKTWICLVRRSTL
jgi:hypothetical protein